MISCRSLVWISPSVQLGAVGDKDELIRFRGQKGKVTVTVRSNMVKKQFENFEGYVLKRQGHSRGTTTAEKLRGTKVWVPISFRSPHPALRVWGYHPRKIFENSDSKSCISNNTCCEIPCFLKTVAKKLGDQYIVGPQPKSWGSSLPRSLQLWRLLVADIHSGKDLTVDSLSLRII